MTCSGVGRVKRNTTDKVYIGLVPISPKTSPSDLTTPDNGKFFSIIITRF